MVCLLWNYGIYLFLFLEMFLMFQDGSGKPESDVHKHHKSHNKIDAMKDIDSVPSNVQSARQEAL